VDFVLQRGNQKRSAHAAVPARLPPYALARARRTRVDVARRRVGPAAVLVRSESPVRGRAAPRDRGRRGARRGRARACGRHCRLDRHGPGQRPLADDRDRRRLVGDAHPPRLRHGRQGRDCRRRRRRRDDRTVDRARREPAVRRARRARHKRRSGLRRPARVPAGAARRRPAGGRCDRRARRSRSSCRRDTGAGAGLACRGGLGGSARAGRSRARRGGCSVGGGACRIACAGGGARAGVRCIRACDRRCARCADFGGAGERPRVARRARRRRLDRGGRAGSARGRLGAGRVRGARGARLAGDVRRHRGCDPGRPPGGLGAACPIGCVAEARACAGEHADAQTPSACKAAPARRGPAGVGDRHRGLEAAGESSRRVAPVTGRRPRGHLRSGASGVDWWPALAAPACPAVRVRSRRGCARARRPVRASTHAYHCSR